MTTIVAFCLVGLVVGILSGIVGIGGGVLVIPILVYFFHMSQHQAQGTSVAMLLPPIGLLATWTYYKAGHVNVQAAACLAAGFLFGGLVGARVATRMDPVSLRRVFGCFLLAVAIHLIAIAPPPASRTAAEDPAATSPPSSASTP